MSLEWLSNAVKEIDKSGYEHAATRQGMLTKPPGSLGRLESIAIRLSAMQQRDDIDLSAIRIVVFAADHGVVEEGVSAFPQAVTVEMIRNFARGGAAISVLAKQLNAQLEVVDCGAAFDLETLEGVVSKRVANGTANFAKQPAMDEAQLAAALELGRDAVQRGLEQGMNLFIGGEMGIGNTSAATAVACALLNIPAEEMAGPGTGLDAQGVSHKAEVINKALALHKNEMINPMNILRCVGGFELAALTGAYLASAQAGVPALVDGFISTAAAMVAVQYNPEVAQWLFLSHASAEPGHRKMIESLNMTPVLDLGMRLGEGSGAAMAAMVLRGAAALHSNMATFEQAAVSEKL